MAFVFRLQKVLEHRRRLEDDAKRAYMDAQSKTALAIRDLDGLYRAIDDARLRGHQLQTGASDRQMAPSLQNVDHFINGQKIRIERQRAVIRDLKSVEEHFQEALIGAARERKTMEKLRERHLSEYRADLARREQSEVDDIATMRYGRGEGP